MGLYEGRGQLTKGMKDLLLHWNETKGTWEDSNTRSFEEKHLVPLEMDLRSALSAMDHMATLLQQIRRDCE
jgi:hypothetical protein